MSPAVPEPTRLPLPSQAAPTPISGSHLVVYPDAYSIRQGGSLSIAAPGVLANDRVSGAGPDAAMTVVLARPPGHGTLRLETDGALLYVPDPGYTGTDSFAYAVVTPEGSAGPAEVSVVVTPAAAAGPGVPAGVAGNGQGAGDPTASPFDVPGTTGDAQPISFGSFGLLGISFEWLVPALVLSVPGLLLLAAVAAQASGGAVWLPVVRRFVGTSRFGRRKRHRTLSSSASP